MAKRGIAKNFPNCFPRRRRRVFQMVSTQGHILRPLKCLGPQWAADHARCHSWAIRGDHGTVSIFQEPGFPWIIPSSGASILGIRLPVSRALWCPYVPELPNLISKLVLICAEYGAFFNSPALRQSMTKSIVMYHDL